MHVSVVILITPSMLVFVGHLHALIVLLCCDFPRTVKVSWSSAVDATEPGRIGFGCCFVVLEDELDDGAQLI